MAQLEVIESAATFGRMKKVLWPDEESLRVQPDNMSAVPATFSRRIYL
jgi:hypothetical protein